MTLQIRDNAGRIVYELVDVTVEDLDPQWSVHLENIKRAVAEHTYTCES